LQPPRERHAAPKGGTCSPQGRDLQPPRERHAAPEGEHRRRGGVMCIVCQQQWCKGAVAWMPRADQTVHTIRRRQNATDRAHHMAPTKCQRLCTPYGADRMPLTARTVKTLWTRLSRLWTLYSKNYMPNGQCRL